MKKTLLIAPSIAVLVSINSVFALGLTAGTVRVLVDVGGTNSSRFGLVNSENETITVSIRAEGDAAQFLQIPNSLELEPKKITYVNVTASIPAAYDGFLGGNITGFIYAVQEGGPGQVQINVQAKKAVQVLIPDYGGRLPETTRSQEIIESEPKETTGFVSFVTTTYWLPALLGVGAFAVIIFVVSKRFEISVKSKRR